MEQTRIETVDEASAGGRASMLMREVNTNLRSLSADLGRTEPIAFFCECRLPRCFAVLWMTNQEYDAAVATGKTWIVLDGHQPSGPFTQQSLPASVAPMSSQVRERRARQPRMEARTAQQERPSAVS